ncbi:Plant transposase (Ptta/En/Spm family) [Fagus crenata]
MPPRSSMVPSQIQSEPPSSQPSGESSTLQPTRPFPSHARHLRPEPSDSTLIPKRGRGSLKGLKVAKKANENSDGKLSIKFLTKLDGPIDINRRSFVDEVVLQIKQHIPIVGVKKWSQIPLEPKNVLKDKVLERWRLVDDDY